MDIALIKPPAVGLEDQLAYPPLGLLYLASNLHGEHEVTVYNMVDGDEEISYAHDLYGVGVHSVASVKAAKDVSRRIRDNTGAKIAWGGAFPTSMPGYSARYADYVLVGEAEQMFANLVDGRIDKQIIKCPPILNLDLLEYPARHLLPKEQVVHSGAVHHSTKPATTVFLTRGCVFECRYCDKNISSRLWRHRSVRDIVGEVQQLIEEYDIGMFRFPDDNLTLNKKWFLKLCDALKPYDIEWTCLSRADGLDENLLEKARESGLKEVFFGIESGSQKMLDVMNKKTRVSDNTAAIQMCRDVGVTSCAYLLVAFPGEDEKTIDETITWLEEAMPDKAKIHSFVPIPGTHVFDNPSQYGVRIRDNWEEQWVYTDPTTGKWHEFGCHYDYLEGGDETMWMLRDRLYDAYKRMGYAEGWSK